MTQQVPFEKSVIDIETDDIKATIIYCIVATCVDTLQQKRFVNKKHCKHIGVEWDESWQDIHDFGAWATANVKIFIAHNGVSFDFYYIGYLLGYVIPIKQIEDTLIMSRLFMPQREGGHSLESWGPKVGCLKLPFDDFSKFSLKMLEYCGQDTLVNVKVYKHLLQEKIDWGFTELSIRIEHNIKEIIWRQELNGFFLDEPKTHQLFAETSKRLTEIETELHKVFCPQPVVEKWITPKFLKGTTKLSSVGLKVLKQYSDQVGMDIQAEHDAGRIKWPLPIFTLEDFNLGSPKQIATRLLEIGWKPLNLTPKGAPKIDEESLAPFAKDFPQVALLSEYLMVRSRNGLAEQWLDAVDKQGYVHGKVNTLGAITGRMTHSDPNMANVPSAAPNVPYGKTCRSCWTIKDKEKYSLVGCDAASLELRMLCHFMGDDEYTKEVVSGDVHTKNQHAAGLPTRDNAKTFIYALIYGAGDGKIGRITGGNAKTGGELKRKLFTTIPKLGKLFLEMGQQARRGYVWGIDGRRIWTRSEHAALNTLLQGSGAVVCKLWAIFIHQMANEVGIDFKQVAQIHDEYQFQVQVDRAVEFGEITKRAMKRVEEVLKSKCPLASEYKVGKAWSECH